MKKAIILLALLALCLTTFSCGGGGAGSADVPSGENPGLPSVVQLLPTHYIAQTNAIITLHTKVLDGNGIPVPNTPVIFTNLSPIGVLIPTSANTDASGIATVTLKSTTTGFATVQAEVNTGAGNVRDRKSVYFTTAIVIYPSLSASIDGDGDGVFDEPDDFILIANGRDTATISAELLDATGTPIAGRTIGFSTDTTYIDCTIEDCTSLNQPYKQEIVFPNGRYAWTNANGEATIEIIASSNIKEFKTSFNVAAQDTTSGATDMFTVFLDPITVGAITVTANPPIVSPTGPDSSKKSVITAYVVTTDGVPVPDGTIVNFTVTPSDLGTIDAFSQTTKGLATATFISSGKEGIATITASAGGVSGSLPLIIETALMVIPTTLTVDGDVGGTATFRIFGGIPPYAVYSDNNPSFPPSPTTVEASGEAFTVTVPPSSCPATVTYRIRDEAGTTVTATLNITTSAPELAIQPDSVTICENDITCAAGTATATFTISGGKPPYTTTSDTTAVIPNPGTGNLFVVNAVNNSISSDTLVTLTTKDSCGASDSASVTVTNQ